MKKYNPIYRMVFILFISLVLTILNGCADTEKKALLNEKAAHDILTGYLDKKEIPDPGLIPPPPSTGTALYALDEEISRKNLALQGTQRFSLAARDADMSFPNSAEIFSCAVDAPITEKDTPMLYRLMRRMLIDAGNLSTVAKNKYWRPRPFLVNKEPTCVPVHEKHMKDNSSYPSGHTIAGWAWALVLAEVAPDRADAILARGRAYGQSRIVCNVHWYSDVMEGYMLGAALSARLHGNPDFRSDLEAARNEIKDARLRGLKPAKDCKAETESLK